MTLDFERKPFNPPAEPSEQDGYRFSDEMVLAVNAALAARRPLLIEGPPGSGKSTLARAVARTLKWSYYEKVITSRTQAEDLLWTYDAVRRLGDARAGAGAVREHHDYVEPGVLWWAQNPETARRRGALEQAAPSNDPVIDKGPENAAIVLLDEIDKADPDVPNDLLVPLDTGRFTVRETGIEVAPDPKRRILLMLTTNKERALPLAFLRRCVLLTLRTPNATELVKIAALRCSSERKNVALRNQLANWLVDAAKSARDNNEREPSTAEYLDAVTACEALGIAPDAEDAAKRRSWEVLSGAILSKIEAPRAGN